METAYMNQPQMSPPASAPTQPAQGAYLQTNYVPVSAGPGTYQVQTVSSSTVSSRAINAGFFGFIVVSTGVMGANLNKVIAGEMNLGQAVTDSVVKGASGAVAAASAAAATSTLTSGGLTGLAVTLATATGVSYLINRVKP